MSLHDERILDSKFQGNNTVEPRLQVRNYVPLRVIYEFIYAISEHLGVLACLLPMATAKSFPTSAGILLGLGLGGFFDGIVFHQILQWHHIATSAGYPADGLGNLKFNILLDGLFHAATYGFTVIGLALLWVRARQPHFLWSARLLFATMLIGFGSFNLVEGAIDHQILGLHHVNETVPKEHWVYWDLAFLIWGAAMLTLGWILKRRASP